MILLGCHEGPFGAFRLGTKGLCSDPADITFLGLCIVSDVSKWSNLLLKMGQKRLLLAPVLYRYVCVIGFLHI